jgi:argonaute-like protein implicated in RNA metabolism and viral defense
MDDIYIPDENEDEEQVAFEKQPIEDERANHPSGVNASGYIRITFDRFVTLVASRSFLEVVERNKNEDVILSTNLLTDLANARRYSPNTRTPLLVLGGLTVGILLGFFLFNT